MKRHYLIILCVYLYVPLDWLLENNLKNKVEILSHFPHEKKCKVLLIVADTSIQKTLIQEGGKIKMPLLKPGVHIVRLLEKVPIELLLEWAAQFGVKVESFKFPLGQYRQNLDMAFLSKQ